MGEVNNESLWGSKAFWYDKEGKNAPWYEHRIRKLEAQLKDAEEVMKHLNYFVGKYAPDEYVDEIDIPYAAYRAKYGEVE